jgi:type IV pilus assembly protein PilM
MIPVPRRMNMGGVGVDISEVSLRFVKLSPKDKGFEVRSFGEYPIPEGAIVLGRIEKPDLLRKVLFALKKEHNIKFVRSSLPESLSYLVEINVPTIKNSELYESVELQIEEHIPLSIADVAFDYHLIGPNKNKPGMTSVVVSATPKSVVQSYQEVFNSVGITLLSLETDSTALARAVIRNGSVETTMILDLGRIKTGVYIVSRGFVSFVSDIDIGGKDISGAIMKGLDISTEEAKELYKHLEQSEKPKKEIFEIVSPVFSELKEEINKHFIFWHTHKDGGGQKNEKIGKIILAGSGATLFGLQDYLSAEFHMPIDTANVWGNLFSFDENIPKISFNESLLFSTAIGLAIYARDK